MEIGFVSHHCCIRVIKEGLALYKANHGVRFIQNKLANESFINVVPWASFYDSPEQLATKATQWDFDLIHVHNEPDWMTPVIKSVRPDLKIIHDCHDLNSARVGKAGEFEAEAVKIADGLIFPSVNYAKHYDRFYGKDDKPKEVIYSMCLDDFLDCKQLPRCNGIVYEGGVSNVKEEGALNYRDYSNVAGKLYAMGIPFYMYGVPIEFISDYGNVGAIPFSPMAYTSLMQQLNRYDWGLCASPIKCNQWDWAMPNKLFEYITAGIPSIVFNAQESAEFVKKHELGVIIDSVDDIPKIYDQHEYYRKKVLEKRHLFIMESQVSKIENLYQRVLGLTN